MKPKKYTVLYLSESVFPIFFCVAIIALEFMFYFRLLGGGKLDAAEAVATGATNVASSSLLDLFPVPFFIAGIVFVVLYMLYRFVILDDNGVTYKDIKKKYFIPWENIRYVKITFNANNVVGRGSYVILSTDAYPLQHTDFRASREDFIVLRYRRSVIKHIKGHYDGEITRASSK